MSLGSGLASVLGSSGQQVDERERRGPLQLLGLGALSALSLSGHLSAAWAGLRSSVGVCAGSLALVAQVAADVQRRVHAVVGSTKGRLAQVLFVSHARGSRRGRAGSVVVG
jgi:hypothetical protein